jgi:hypothetical protein
VVLNFDPSQNATLEVQDSQGTVRNLELAFPAHTSTIEESDVDAGLDDLRSYLDGVLEAAQAAGVPATSLLFAPVEVRRVRRGGFDFGSLEVNLRLRPGPGSAKGRVSVVSQTNLNLLGFDDARTGRFLLGVGAGVSNLESYLDRALLQAEADAGYTFANRLLGDTIVSYDSTLNVLAIKLFLSAVDGGEGASLEMVSQSGLEGLGFDNVAPVPGESDPNKQNSLRYEKSFLNHVFTAAVNRIGVSQVDLFDPYASVLIGIVGAPPAGEWGASQPNVSGLRMFTKTRTAKYLPDDSVTLKKPWTGTILDKDPDNSTTAHELGHAFGLEDYYKQAGYRDDLQYMDGWDLMGNSNLLNHFGGYSKYYLGWIPDDRVEQVPLPSPAGPTSAEALLVPVEFWDDGMVEAVTTAFGGSSLPVAQLMSINLGGDGVQTDLVEARQPGLTFSHHLPHGPGLLATNAIDPDDTTRYGFKDKYRRKLHRLNSGSDLQAAGDAFDLATAPELAARGVKVSVVDVIDVVRPYGLVKAFHTRVEREQADYVDPCFTQTTPPYKSPDIWVDWAGDNASDRPDDHRVFEEGTPDDQGETVHYPASGSELHWVVARVHNRGKLPVLNVKVNAYKWDPPGGGDTGDKTLFRSGTIDEVPADGWVTLPLAWMITPDEHEHQCLLCRIVDWKLP